MDYRIIPINMSELSEDEWKKVHTYRKKYHDAVEPEEPFEPDKAWQQMILVKVNHPEQSVTLFLIESVQTNEMIGLFGYGEFNETSPSYENLKHVAFMILESLPDYRNLGIEDDAMRRVYEYSKTKNKRVLVYTAWEPDVREYVEKVGFESALSNIENRLYLEKLDWDMVEKWAQEGKNRNPSTKIVMFEYVPDDILEEYTNVLGETMNQVPRGSLDVGDMVYTPETVRKMEENKKAAGRESLNVITVEEDGKISGLTWLSYAPSKEVALGQGLTSVQEKYRGRGLGKWVKAVALLEAKNRYPKAKFISTHNATSNAPMLAINDKLGFAEHRILNNYQIPIEKLGIILEQIETTH